MMIERILEQRVEHIKRSTPWIVIESYISQANEGDWGLIVTLDRDRGAKEYWFFESGCSFNRPEAIDQYNTYVDAGFTVTVACPESCVSALSDKISSSGRPGIKVLSLRSMGIQFNAIPPKLYPQVTVG